MYRHIFLLGAIILALWTGSLAVEVEFSPCVNQHPTNYTCEVHDVNIEPCAEAATTKRCVFKRKTVANIQFKFTADHAVDTLKGQAFWVAPANDLPLLGMDTNACAATECPVQENVQQLYNYTLQILKSFPLRNYEIKWKLWDKDVDPTFECCFVTSIKIVK